MCCTFVFPSCYMSDFHFFPHLCSSPLFLIFSYILNVFVVFLSPSYILISFFLFCVPAFSLTPSIPDMSLSVSLCFPPYFLPSFSVFFLLLLSLSCSVVFFLLFLLLSVSISSPSLVSLQLHRIWSRFLFLEPVVLSP